MYEKRGFFRPAILQDQIRWDIPRMARFPILSDFSLGVDRFSCGKKITFVRLPNGAF
jgi:hypothetical protein